MVGTHNKIKLIITLGPSSLNKKILKQLKEDVDIFRLNMSHLSIEQLKKNLRFLKKNNIRNICIDTEGAQVRTISIKKKKALSINQKVIISFPYFKIKDSINLYPQFSFRNVNINSQIKIGFDGLKLKIIKKFKDKLLCKVLSPGFVEANKGVHFDSHIKLNCLTKKDLEAIKIAKAFGVRKFALSFANTQNDVQFTRSLIKKNDDLISKIETKVGFLNRIKIIKESDAILIDRGDLSRYIDIAKIPLAQRILVKDAKKIGKKVYIATNLLETMINSNEPTRAESNDVYSSIESGCSGLVLAAETAIGKYPVECVKFLKKCIKVIKYHKKLILNPKEFF